jgi:large subunit ribosomal protein L24
MSIRKGDQVVVIAGKDKGKKGKVILVEDDKVIVEGVNIIIKNKKARNAKQKSSRERKAGAIHISNVQILCKCGVAARVAHKIDEKGNKHRICGKCGEILDKKFVKAKEKVKETETAGKEKKEEEKSVKTPLQRREIKHTAESKIKKPQNVVTKTTGHRQLGGE